MAEVDAGKQIDEIIKLHGGWKAECLKQLREIILKAHPKIYEEDKWRIANRPEGLPVWSYNGIICFAEIWKDNVKLIFQKGSQLSDHHKLFNARLNSSKIRAIEIHVGDQIDEDGIAGLVKEAIKINS